MKQLLIRIGSKLLDYKMYIGRASSYIALTNTGMILLLFLSKLQDYDINIPIKSWGIPIYIMTFLLCIYLGYLDVKHGLYKAEISKSQRQNPEILHIIKELSEIKAELRKRK